MRWQRKQPEKPKFVDDWSWTENLTEKLARLERHQKQWAIDDANKRRRECENDKPETRQRRQAWVHELLNYVNNYRTRQHISPLLASDELMNSAQAKADDMYIRDYYAHEDPDGNTARYAENIAMGQPSPYEVFQAWAGSDGHRLNMLNLNHRVIGIGERHLRWVQHFGR